MRFLSIAGGLVRARRETLNLAAAAEELETRRR
jgi:hypothetical protein